MRVTNFPWPYYANDETKEVWVHVPGGYPTVLGLPYVVTKHFPGYTGRLCTENFLQSLKENEQKESN